MQLEAHPQISPDPVACAHCPRVIAAGERYRAFTLHGADDPDAENVCEACFEELCRKCRIDRETEESDL